MFEKILDILEKVWTLATPVVVCHPWHGGGIMRFGRWNREVKAGYHAKWPFLEDYQLTEVCDTTERLQPQSLVTKDDVSVVVSSIVKYAIRDVRKYICDVWDQRDVLADTTMGAIARSVRDHTYEELMQGEVEKDVLTVAKRAAGKYGFEVIQVTFTDRAKARSLRLIVPGVIKDLDN